MIPLEPNLKEIGKLPVPRDVPRRKVAMVIKNRLVRRILMIQPRRCPGLEKKVRVNEAHTAGIINPAAPPEQALLAFPKNQPQPLGQG